VKFLGMGSLAVLDEFFGEEFGKNNRLNPKRLMSQSREDLRRLLAPLNIAGVPGFPTAGDWAAQLRLELEGRDALVPIVAKEGDRLNFLIYSDVLVMPDPFGSETLYRWTKPATDHSGLLPYLRYLAELAPYVRSGHIILVPEGVGTLFAENQQWGVNPFGRGVDELAEDLWFERESAKQGWSDPSAPGNSTITSANGVPIHLMDTSAWRLASHRLDMYGISIALGADPIDFTKRKSGSLSSTRHNYSVSRSAQLAEFFLPTFKGLSISELAVLRKDSAAAAAVRATLATLLDSPPQEATSTEAADWIRDLVRAELQPRLGNLLKEVSARPAADVVVSATVALGAALAEVQFTGAVGPATAVAGGASMLPVSAQWISRGRGLGSERRARRVIARAIEERRGTDGA